MENDCQSPKESCAKSSQHCVATGLASYPGSRWAWKERAHCLRMRLISQKSWEIVNYSVISVHPWRHNVSSCNNGIGRTFPLKFEIPQVSKKSCKKGVLLHDFLDTPAWHFLYLRALATYSFHLNFLDNLHPDFHAWRMSSPNEEDLVYCAPWYQRGHGGVAILWRKNLYTCRSSNSLLVTAAWVSPLTIVPSYFQCISPPGQDAPIHSRNHLTLSRWSRRN